MAVGEDPTMRHDETLWLPSDLCRANNGGRKWKYRAVVVRILGDWMEKCSTLGFPTWSSLIRPCPSCNATKTSMFEHLLGVSKDCMPWRKNEHDDYFDACKRCEIIVLVTRDVQKFISKHLVYDKKRKGWQRSLSFSGCARFEAEEG